MRVVVLPSPYLGPAAYGPLAEALGADVARLPPQPFSAADVLLAFAAATTDAGLVVPHSNAGLYAAALGRPTVFVDAALPTRHGGPTALAPPGLAAGVAALADESGLLPPWTRWWGREDISQVLPDPWFATVDAGAPRVPASYLTETLDVPREWTAAPAGYLAFGDTYAQESALAESFGWPVRRLPGAHLLHLADPWGVADAIRGLAGRAFGEIAPET